MSTTEGAKPTSVTAVVIAIYLIVVSILTVCFAATAVGLGGLTGALTGALQNEVTTTEGEAVVSALGEVSGLVTLLGIVGLVLGVAAFVVAIGMFMRKPWSYRGAIVVNVVYIAWGVLNLLTGQGGLQLGMLIPIIISAVVLFFLFTDQGLKRTLGVAAA